MIGNDSALMDDHKPGVLRAEPSLGPSGPPASPAAARPPGRPAAPRLPGAHPRRRVRGLRAPRGEEPPDRIGGRSPGSPRPRRSATPLAGGSRAPGEPEPEAAGRKDRRRLRGLPGAEDRPLPARAKLGPRLDRPSRPAAARHLLSVLSRRGGGRGGGGSANAGVTCGLPPLSGSAATLGGLHSPLEGSFCPSARPSPPPSSSLAPSGIGNWSLAGPGVVGPGRRSPLTLDDPPPYSPPPSLRPFGRIPPVHAAPPAAQDADRRSQDLSDSAGAGPRAGVTPR
ncbi:basic proline-rich protein-like [Tachyglossus aculeatus]|uniref:basic proline-rich protein-like n=1 Tax=Tachyglossus aculeatus TaxID=9261 RepID=UPI0018F44816|nr:basic proline-rich protein-like [Tachyglossus aculeatus]